MYAEEELILRNIDTRGLPSHGSRDFDGSKAPRRCCHPASQCPGRGQGYITICCRSESTTEAAAPETQAQSPHQEDGLQHQRNPKGYRRQPDGRCHRERWLYLRENRLAGSIPLQARQPG